MNAAPRPRPDAISGGARLLAFYDALLRQHGHRNWWPGRTRFEIIAGAILTQNTAWKNVEKTIAGLRARGLLRPAALRDLPEGDLALLIRPSGYFRQKARKLKAFLSYLDAHHGGSLARMARAPTEDLRVGLLSVWGIGPETADSILLYAFGRPVFVVDAYTQRIVGRHGLHEARGYEEIRAYFEGGVPREASLYNDFHAQIVRVGQLHCRTVPRCGGCPLQWDLPGGAPLPDR